MPSLETTLKERVRQLLLSTPPAKQVDAVMALLEEAIPGLHSNSLEQAGEGRRPSGEAGPSNDPMNKEARIEASFHAADAIEATDPYDIFADFQFPDEEDGESREVQTDADSENEVDEYLAPGNGSMAACQAVLAKLEGM